MSDTDPLGFACTLEGEEAQAANTLRRQASALRAEADTLDHQASWHEERAAWAATLASTYEKAQAAHAS